MIREVVAIAYRSLRMVILRVSRRNVNVVASADSIQPRTVLGIIFSVLHFWHAKRGTLATRRSAPAVSVIEIHDLCDEPAPLRWRIGRLLLSCTGSLLAHSECANVAIALAFGGKADIGQSPRNVDLT